MPPGVRLVCEQVTGEFPLHQHPEWTADHPWLVQGTTGRGIEGLDMGLFGEVPTGVAQARWRRLREVTGMGAAVHARQVHGNNAGWHDRPQLGLMLVEDLDGHATSSPDLLLTVSVADCVPIFLVSSRPRAVCLLHGGWRGVAAGIVEAGIGLLNQRAGAVVAGLQLHAGPAICRECYEVGPEVAAALQLPGVGPDRWRLDLRAAIAQRGVIAGIPPARITISTHCTRCGVAGFWSHRGGCRERQLGVAGIRR